MKVSLICTLLNEATTLESLLESIATQTHKPDEVIFVDAGSTDATVSILKKARQRSPFPVRLIRKHTNRSQGRNLAISKAKYQLIAATDAGCVLDRSWLERITKPLQRDQADAVAGFYLPITTTPFEQAVATFVTVSPDNFDPATFLPSSRSVAFTKDAWQKAGHYPHDLNYCEDLVFASKLKQTTRLVITKTAIVYWRQTTNLAEFFKQISGYATGDIKAAYRPHLKKIFSVFARYLIFILLPPVFVLYLFWPLYKHRHHVHHPLAFGYLPFLQLTSDAAVIYGTLRALQSKHSPHQSSQSPNFKSSPSPR